MTERLGVFAEDELGLWKITCADCPLLPHTRALGQKDPECVGGMVTNMQGPVVLKRCEHLGRAGDGGMRADGDALFMDCGKEAGTA